jgi:hypothetical protein
VKDGRDSDIPPAGKFETMRNCAHPHCFRAHRIAPLGACRFEMLPPPGPHHALGTFARAYKPSSLLQFPRPSLRNAVTAERATEDCSSKTRWANLVGGTRVRSGITQR